MSKASFIKDKEFEWFLSSVGEWLPAAIEDALRAGAAVIAAEMKKNLRGVISDRQAVQLVNSFGITPVGQSRDRTWNVHLGFDGYQQPGTGKWKASGIPFQMIARVFESGSLLPDQTSDTPAQSPLFCRADCSPARRDPDRR